MLARRASALLDPYAGPPLAPRPHHAREAPAWGHGLPIGRPFRAPHHTASVAALAGSRRHAGEVALAAGGVLFLDQVGEFPAASLRALRAAVDALPEAERPWVIGATNLCPCGALGRPRRTEWPRNVCTCPPSVVAAWVKRVRAAWPWSYAAVLDGASLDPDSRAAWGCPS
jgi:magnesium chelatase family protein